MLFGMIGGNTALLEEVGRLLGYYPIERLCEIDSTESGPLSPMGSWKQRRRKRVRLI